MEKTMKKLSLLCIAAVISLFMAGCLKAPDEPASPSLKLVYEEDKGYTLLLTTGIHNENPQHALTDISGKVRLVRENQVLAETDFSLETVLPFGTAAIEKSIPVDRESAEKILPLTGKGMNELHTRGSASILYIDEKYIQFKDLSWKSRDIVDLLRERSS